MHIAGAVVAVFATTISSDVVANTATTAPMLFFCFCHSRAGGNDKKK